jgi:hypothetical protein
VLSAGVAARSTSAGAAAGYPFPALRSSTKAFKVSLSMVHISKLCNLSRILALSLYSYLNKGQYYSTRITQVAGLVSSKVVNSFMISLGYSAQVLSAIFHL